LWTQAQQSPAHQTDILRVIAPHCEGLAFADIERNLVSSRNQVSEADIRAALDKLQDHDVVEQVDGVWRIRVELMRRWVNSKLDAHKRGCTRTEFFTRVYPRSSALVRVPKEVFNA
jgi:hypothetical protein